MEKKNNILKWAVVLIVLSLLPSTVVINAEEESLTYEEHIAILDTLPYFLEGTILDGIMSVIVTEDGEPLDFIDSSQYDLVISRDEEQQIFDDARDAFIAMYEIDPYSPEPPEEISTLTETEILEISEFIHSSDDYYQGFYQQDAIESDPIGDGPHQEDGKMAVIFFYPTDQIWVPRNIERLRNKCVNGWSRFEEFDIDIYWSEWYGKWDGPDNILAGEQLADFRSDWQTFGLPDQDFVVNMGLVRLSNHNGIAYLNSFWCLVAERNLFLNIAKDRIAQHELTHCIGDIDDDDGWWWWNHDWNSCVVNYAYMFFGTNHWCDNCRNTLYNEIWNY